VDKESRGKNKLDNDTLNLYTLLMLKQILHCIYTEQSNIS